MSNKLLFRFLMHQASPQEIDAVNLWISQSEENAAWLFEMERTWSWKHELKYAEKKTIDQAFHRFLTEIEQRNPKRKTVTAWYQQLFSWKYATAAVLLVLLTANLFRMNHSSFQGMNEIVVPQGQSIHLTLSDGTRVWLNAASKLSYPSQFAKNERKVTLEGEAFFEVVHNKDIPFSVQTKRVKITDIGTKFDVKAYQNEPTLITLLEGSVLANTCSQKIIMKPNQRIMVNEHGQMKIDSSIDAFALSQWRKGELVFINESLGSIANTLSRKYNIQIKIANEELSKEIFNSKIQEGVSLTEVLTILKNTRKVNYVINENTIILTNY